MPQLTIPCKSLQKAIQDAVLVILSTFFFVQTLGAKLFVNSAFESEGTFTLLGASQLKGCKICGICFDYGETASLGVLGDLNEDGILDVVWYQPTQQRCVVGVLNDTSNATEFQLGVPDLGL